ncbi:metal ABC transporter ATP-binding protein [bacterium]|nr:metal ABC transporter ATP-binding protein [bacterium]
MKLVEFADVSFNYDSSPTLIDINFSIEKNDFVAIVGPNGGGKSTLLKLILAQLAPSKGTITIFGDKNYKSLEKLGYVPQFTTHQHDFPLRLIDMVLQSKLRNNSFFVRYSKQDKERATEILKMLKIGEYKDRFLSELSGGQRQRALIARALIDDPEILILDEPTASVDISVEQDIYDILKELNKNITILLVTHDVSFVSKYVNKVFCVNRYLHAHKLDDLTDNDAQEVYNKSMKMIKHQCGL